MDYRYSKDTIDGIIGHWIDVESKEFNLKGYLFSPYVYYGELVNNEIGKNDMRFTYEGLNQGEFDYHPKLKWYGIYKVNNTYRKEEIQTELQLLKVEADSNYSEISSNYDQRLIIKTNNTKKSEFIIGTNQSDLIEGSIITTHETPVLGYKKSYDNGFLYPAMTKHLYFHNRNYIIKGIEKVEIDSTSYKLKKLYDLTFEIWQREEIKYFKSLGSDLDFCCDAEQHANYQTPKLNWVGDLNKNDILDCIIYQHTMTEGCGVCWEYSLFLSKINGDKISLNFIDTAVRCH